MSLPTMTYCRSIFFLETTNRTELLNQEGGDSTVNRFANHHWTCFFVLSFRFISTNKHKTSTKTTTTTQTGKIHENRYNNKNLHRQWKQQQTSVNKNKHLLWEVLSKDSSSWVKSLQGSMSRPLASANRLKILDLSKSEKLELILFQI